MLSYVFICPLLAAVTAAASLPSDCTLENTPRFLYMKKQINSYEEGPSSKLSLSMAPTQIHVDVIEEGFRVSKKSKLQLSFDLSTAAEKVADIDNSELWLFPDQVAAGDMVAEKDAAVRLTFHVTAQSLSFKKKTTVTYEWDAQGGSCMPLDVSTLMQRVLKKKRKAEDLAEILITIETTHIEVLERSGDGKQQQTKDACEAMERRGCNTPFLVFQYHPEQAIPDELPLSDLVNLRPHPETGVPATRTRRDDVEVAAPSAVRTNQTKDTVNCSRRPLWVDFRTTELPVVEKTNFDLGTCVGSCSSPDLIPSTARLSVLQLFGHRQQTCCLPSTYSDLEFLLVIESVLITYTLPDVIVTSCSCTVF